MAGLQARAIVGNRVGVGEALGRRRAPEARRPRRRRRARRAAKAARAAARTRQARREGRAGLQVGGAGDSPVMRASHISGLGAVLRRRRLAVNTRAWRRKRGWRGRARASHCLAGAGSAGLRPCRPKRADAALLESGRHAGEALSVAKGCERPERAQEIASSATAWRISSSLRVLPGDASGAACGWPTSCARCCDHVTERLPESMLGRAFRSTNRSLIRI